MKLTRQGFATSGILAFLSGIQVLITPAQAQNIDAPCFMIDSSGSIVDLSQICQNNDDRHPPLNITESGIPQDTNAIHTQASRYFGVNNFQGAIDSYTQALQIQSDRAETYFWRGLAYREMGNRQLAIEDFQQAAQFHREQGDERNALAAQIQLDRLLREE